MLVAVVSTAGNALGGSQPLLGISVSYGAAFGGGLLSFFSPCILPLIPVFFGVLMAGAASNRARFLRGATFTIGMSLFFFIVGLGAGGLGTFFQQNMTLMNIISGSLFILFGFLYLFEIGFRGVKVNLWRFGGTAMSGFVIGALLGIVWIPCAGPVLGSILVLAANQQTASHGGLLLFVYSLGLSIPFLTLSGFVSKLTSKVSFAGESRVRKVVRVTVFVLLVGAGILTMFDLLNLLQIFT